MGKSGYYEYIFVLSKSKPISYDESNYLENYPGMVGQDAPKEREIECCEQRGKADAKSPTHEGLPL